MDGERFDAMTGILGQRHDRRGALRRLAAAAVGATGFARVGGAEARPKRKNTGMSWREICEMDGGVFRPSPLGGGSCKLRNGYEVRCDDSGQCYSVCHVREGCSCEKTKPNFCNTGLSQPATTPGTGPIGGVVNPVIGGVVKPAKPGTGGIVKPGQGATAGTGGAVLKRGRGTGRKLRRGKG